MDAMSIDMAVAGNTGTALGSLDSCLGNVDAGATITFDVTATGIPETNPMLAFAWKVFLDDSLLTITAIDNNYLLAANPDSSLLVDADATPDSNINGTFNDQAIDVSSQNAEFESGVLTRVTVQVSAEAATGVYPLFLSGDSAHIDPSNSVLLPAILNHAAVAVGQPCPADLPTPNPSPVPTPQPTPEPTVEPTATPIPPPINDNFADATRITSLPFSDTVSLVSATSAPGDPDLCLLGFSVSISSVWYAFTAPVEEDLRLDFAGNQWSLATVYRGANRDDLTVLDCNYAVSGEPSKISFHASANDTYYLQIGQLIEPYMPSGSLQVDLANEQLSSISGRVVDSAGNPVAGAELDIMPERQCCWGTGNRSVYSDDAGNYTMTDVPADSYYLSASHETYLTAYWTSTGNTTNSSPREALSIPADSALTGVDFTLYHPGAITGRVTDTQGNPVSGADVYAFGDGSNYYQPDDPRYNTRTDADGHYTFASLNSGSYRVVASGNGYEVFYNDAGLPGILSEATSIALPRESVISGIDITLGPLRYSTISGTVRDNFGNPIKGASICIRGHCSYYPYAVTDDQGRFTIRYLSSGDYTLDASHPLYRTEYWTSTGGTPAAGEAEAVHVASVTDVTGIDFSLTKLGVITGRITDMRGSGISGASVWADSGCTSTRANTTADANGYYTLAALQPGTYQLGASADGYVTYYYSDAGSGSCSGADSVSAALDTVASGIDIMLPRVASISGRILDTAGRPIALANVTAARAQCCASASVTANYQGEYSIPNLPPGDYILRASSALYTTEYWTPSGGSPYHGQPVPLQEGHSMTGVDFSLARPSSISGRITDRYGNPLTGAVVEAESTDCRPCFTTSTGGDGSYYFFQIAIGDYKIKASYEGLLTEYWTSAGGTRDPAKAEPITVAEEQTVKGINLSLDPEACRADVNGDSVVNHQDAVLVARSLGTRTGASKRATVAFDLDYDGRITIADLRVVQSVISAGTCA